jgi:hypothetical protein
MWAWYQARKQQQISYPLDEASKASLGVPTGQGAGSSTPNQTTSIPPTGGSVTAPVPNAGTFLLNVAGVTYEIGYIRTI